MAVTPLPPRVRRSVTVLGVAAGLVGAFATGTAVTGGDDPGTDRRQPAGDTDASPVAFSGSDLSLAESCDELLDWYIARGVDRVGPWGWNYGYGDGMVALAEGGAVADQAAAPADGSSSSSVTSKAPGPLPSTSRVTNDDSGTNVQELGVDEPDVVKTDGRTLFRVEGNDLTTYDVTGDEVVRLGSADLVDLRDGELLLAGDTVVAIGSGGPTSSADGYGTHRQTRVIVLDVSDPSAPRVEHTYLYSSSTLEVRLHGDTVRLVTQAGLPDLDFEQAGRHDERDAERENREVVRESDIDDWLPTVSTDGGKPERLVDCEDVAIPDDGDTLGTIAVVGFAADEPDERSTTGLAVDTQLAYVSADKLYLATTPAWDFGGCWDFCPMVDSVAPRWFPGGDDGVSHLYAFDLDGRATTYAASGEVDGSVRDRWAMDEAGGVLRVAVGPTAPTGNFNSIVTFRQDGNDLVEAGRVDKLGVNEQIQSMRWFDGLAIMVTFRQVDPLYAIDLTDPDEPRLMGQLKIPGFSAYLHPLGQHRLLGLGEGPTPDGRSWGAQAGLFNVTDLTDPRRLDVVSYGRDSFALATQDPRQLTWLPQQRKVLTVISDYRKGGQVGLVSVLSLGDGHLENRSVEVEYGSDVSAVRLVPLPDGRVVLVTGGDAEFFEL